ncbi:MAG: ATP-binding protein [Thermodesulfovibrionales bacterium]|nr:ATP-binding protein [Thermodesulfovibrionales bacterium]
MFLLESIVNSLDEAIFLFDRKGRLIFMNKAGEEFLGRNYEEVKNKRFKYLFRNTKNIAVLIEKSVKEGRMLNCKEMEVDIGRITNMDINISPFYSDYSGSIENHATAFSAEGVILCMRENLALTDREDYHFESLLYLLGCIAHEIKNPLSGIKGAAQILKEYAQDSSSRECVNLILKEADRLNSVLNSYLTMTRKPVLNQLNIHEIIEHALKIMKITVEDNRIKVYKSYDPSLPNIYGDESKLLQVFINFFKNAVEAMDATKEKVLQISTRPSNEYMVIYEKGYPDMKGAKSKKQRWVVINIQDSGIGISKDEIKRVFLPFYTKKAGGSGLGLSLSKKIVKDHGGIVRVKSKEGAGSIFSVYLPLSLTSSN